MDDRPNHAEFERLKRQADELKEKLRTLQTQTDQFANQIASFEAQVSPTDRPLETGKTPVSASIEGSTGPPGNYRDDISTLIRTWEQGKPETPPGVMAPALRPAGDAKAKPSPSSDTTELIIGRTWLNRAGAIVLLLGVSFFVKYSFDQGWIDPALRVILAAILGLGLIGVGEWCLAREMRPVAGGLLGCGVGSLYVAIFGAFNFYHLISPPLAMALFCATTGLAALVALHANILPVGLIAIAGGYLTPIALRTGINQQRSLLTYVLVVDVGFLALAWARRWDVLRPLTWIGTVALFGGWCIAHYTASQWWATWLFATVFYLLYEGDSVVWLLRARITWRRLAAALIHANNAAYFLGSLLLLQNAAPGVTALFALGLGAMQWGVAWLLNSRRVAIRASVLALWVDGAAILAMVAPLYFDRYLVTLAWSVQALATLAFARRFPDAWLRVKAVGLLFAAAAHVVLIELGDPKLSAELFSVAGCAINWVSVLAIFVGACGYGGAALMMIGRSPTQSDKHAMAFLSLGGTLWLLWFCAYQWERYIATWWWVGVTLGWWVVALRRPSILTLPLALCVAVAIKYCMWDTLAAMDGLWSQLSGILFNRAVITGFLVVLLVIFGRAVSGRISQSRTSEAFYFPPMGVLAVLAALVFVWTGTFETMRVFKLEPLRERFPNPALVMHVVLSVFWGACAMAYLVIGFARQIAVLRKTALALFGVTVVKLLLFDLSSLNTVYRILSFLALGVLLLAASVLYQRLASRLAAPS